MAVGSSVTKLLQSINSAAKLAAKYSQEDDDHEKKKLRAQLVVECVNILVAIITLILATQGQLAAAVWTNAIMTVLARSTGEIYEVYCDWKKHIGDRSLMESDALLVK